VPDSINYTVQRLGFDPAFREHPMDTDCFLDGYKNVFSSSLQFHADKPLQYRLSHLHTTPQKNSKNYSFPKVELFQLARNTDITEKRHFWTMVKCV
jgi:hypothetical protein